MTFVPRRSELAYPSLSDGILARYCPSLTGITGGGDAGGFHITDLSGRGRHGFNGVNWSPDFWELNEGKYALRFRARFSNEDFRVPKAAIDSLNPTNAAGSTSPFSSSMWFRKTGSFSGFNVLQDSANRHCSVWAGNGANSMYFAWKGATGYVATTPFTMLSDKWYHLAVTVDRTNTVRPYLDGLPFTTGSAGSTWDTGGSDFFREIRYGTNPSGGGDGWVGFQDDINLYDRVLTQQEILQLGSERGAAYKRIAKRTSFNAAIGVITRSESHTLGLTQTAGSGISAATNTLSLTQSAIFFKAGSLSTPVSHSLGFTQSATARGYELSTDFLLLDSIALFRIGLPTAGFFINQSLGFIETVRRGQNYGVNQTLAFAQSAFRANTGAHSLGFTQAVVFGRGLRVTSLLSLAQSVLVNSRLGRSLPQVFGLIDSVAYYYESICTKSRYSRFEGAGHESLIPVKSYTQKTPVSFETLTGTRQIIPITPVEMDNKHRLSFDRVNRETSGGELEVYRDPSWVPTQTLLFTIRGLKAAVFLTLKAFMYSTLGQEVLFNDWVGASWQGVITNPDEPATEDQDGYWTLAFEFVGKPYAGPPAFAPLAFSQTATFTL